jgi:hypothetical protein
MNLKEIYVAKKNLLDSCYMDFYNAVKEDIEDDEDFTLSDDELDELVLDLMLSNVLGKIARFEDISELIKE